MSDTSSVYLVMADDEDYYTSSYVVKVFSSAPLASAWIEANLDKRRHYTKTLTYELPHRQGTRLVDPRVEEWIVDETE